MANSLLATRELEFVFKMRKINGIYYGYNSEENMDYLRSNNLDLDYFETLFKKLELIADYEGTISMIKLCLVIFVVALIISPFLELLKYHEITFKFFIITLILQTLLLFSYFYQYFSLLKKYVKCARYFLKYEYKRNNSMKFDINYWLELKLNCKEINYDNFNNHIGINDNEPMLNYIIFRSNLLGSDMVDSQQEISRDICTKFYVIKEEIISPYSTQIKIMAIVGTIFSTLLIMVPIFLYIFEQFLFFFLSLGFDLFWIFGWVVYATSLYRKFLNRISFRIADYTSKYHNNGFMIDTNLISLSEPTILIYDRDIAHIDKNKLLVH